MSIVVAAKINDRIYIGADRQVTFGSSKYLLPGDTPKWTVVGPTAVGMVGDLEITTQVHREAVPFMGSLTHRTLSPDTFVANLRKAMRPFDHVTQKEAPAPAFTALYVRAHHKEITLIERNGGLIQVDFAAIGSGETAADGAWQIVKGMGMSPEKKLYQVIAAACAVDIYCGGEPFVKELTSSDKGSYLP